MKISNLIIVVLLAAIVVLVKIQDNKNNEYLGIYFPRSLVWIYPNQLKVEFENHDSTLTFNSNKELNDYLGWLAIREMAIDRTLHNDEDYLTWEHVIPGVKKIPVEYWDYQCGESHPAGYIMQVQDSSYHTYIFVENAYNE